MAKTEVIFTRLSADEKAALERLAAQAGVKPSQYWRSILREQINQKPDLRGAEMVTISGLCREVNKIGLNINRKRQRNPL